jgi:hypothetical protein
MRTRVILVLLAIWCVQVGIAVMPMFEDIASAARVTAVVRSGSAEKKYLIEMVTGGVCLLDYDNDGLLDIYIVNGSSLEAHLAGKPGHGNRLYRNLGSADFRDVTASMGVGGNSGWGM